MSVVFITPSPAKGMIPAELSLLSHQVKTANSLQSGVAQLVESSIMLLDGRIDLSWAKENCLKLNRMKLSSLLVLLISPSGLSIISPDWGFKDFILATAEPAEWDVRLKLALSQINAEVISAGPVIIDEASYSATLDGQSLDLTYTEFELLKYLALHPGRVLTREQLLSQVWGYDYYGGTRTVDVHIRRLRAKLGQYDSYIHTVRNVGYRFSPER